MNEKVFCFQTRVDRTSHEIIVTTPKGESYRFDIDQALSFADGLLRSAALACGDNDSAIEVFRMKLDEMAEDLDPL